MQIKIIFFFVLFIFGQTGFAAVLHFYKNPRVPQLLFHVQLQYNGDIYEADPHAGGVKTPLSKIEERGDFQIEIPDSLVNQVALEGQLGLSFDFEFIWNNDKTYCSKLVGIALGIKPQPMDFRGTHYLKFHPEWIDRHDLGISPDQVFEFGLQHGRLLQPIPIN